MTTKTDDPKLRQSRIVWRAVNDLLPYPNNARTHTEDQVTQIAASIKEFGWTNPLIIHNETVVAGHARLAAARKLGMTEVPCIDRSDMSEAQWKAYVLADNRLAQNAGWDEGLLRLELMELDSLDFELDLLGFDEKELANLLQPSPAEGLTDPDDVPEDVEPITQPGDLWVLGNHRLLCGDATKAEDVQRVLDGAKPFIMVTDPAYGVEYDPAWRDVVAEHLHGGSGGRIGRVTNDDTGSWGRAYQHFSGAVVYVWHDTLKAVDSLMDLEAARFIVRSQLIWAKQSHAISRGHYHWQHEGCWYAVRKGESAKWCGDRSQSTIWKIDSRSSTQEETKLDGKLVTHGTQKPVECMERPIRNHGDRDDAVYDPFLGSGTTLIAAERQQRKGYFIEIDPHYVDVAVARWEAFTGQKGERHAAANA